MTPTSTQFLPSELNFGSIKGPATIIDQANSRYHRIEHQPQELEKAFVDIFLQSHFLPPRQIILDLDVTDDQVHGNLSSSISSNLAL